MQKVKLEFDPFNRLVLVPSGAKSPLARFRQTIDGKFTLDKNNELSYHVKAPLTHRDIPNQIRLNGRWSLTDNHQLRITLNKSSRDIFGDTVTLDGDIIDVRHNAILFAVTTKTEGGNLSTYVLTLGGTWAADQNNRLSFRVERESGKSDILTFTGTWQIGLNHQIVYQYEKSGLARKKHVIHELMFKGYWDILSAGRISYVLNAASNTAFNFKASAGMFKGDRIQYELGIGAAKKLRPVAMTITLFGTWNIQKDAGITFEVEYENGKFHTIAFGATARLSGKDMITLELKSGSGNRDIGVTVELSRRLISGDGEAFIRFLATKGEQAIYAGGGWRW